MLRLQELTQGANLIGRQAVYQQDGTGSFARGTVEAVFVEHDELFVRIDGQSLPISHIEALVAD